MLSEPLIRLRSRLCPTRIKLRTFSSRAAQCSWWWCATLSPWALWWIRWTKQRPTSENWKFQRMRSALLTSTTSICPGAQTLPRLLRLDVKPRTLTLKQESWEAFNFLNQTNFLYTRSNSKISSNFYQPDSLHLYIQIFNQFLRFIMIIICIYSILCFEHWGLPLSKANSTY